MTLIVDYKGIDRAIDRAIEKAARRHRVGSGYCFVDGRRDLSFEFTRRAALEAAKKRIKSALGRKVRVFEP